MLGLKPSSWLRKLQRGRVRAITAIMAVKSEEKTKQHQRKLLAVKQRRPRIADLKRWKWDCQVLVDCAVQRLQSGM